MPRILFLKRGAVAQAPRENANQNDRRHPERGAAYAGRAVHAGALSRQSQLTSGGQFRAVMNAKNNK